MKLKDTQARKLYLRGKKPRQVNNLYASKNPWLGKIAAERKLNNLKTGAGEVGNDLPLGPHFDFRTESRTGSQNKDSPEKVIAKMIQDLNQQKLASFRINKSRESTFRRI